LNLIQGRQKEFYGWWAIGACLLLLLYTSGITFFGFTAIFEPIADTFGWSYAQISLAVTVRSLGMLILVPLLGFLTDRWGPRRIISGGVIVFGLGLVLLSRTSSLSMFYTAYALISIGKSMTSLVVMAKIAFNWWPNRVGIATGVMASGVGLGGLMVPLITVLTDILMWQKAMFSLGLGILVFGLPLSFVIRNKPGEYGHIPNDKVINQTVLKEDRTSVQRSDANITAKQGLASRAFWHIALSTMCFSFVVSTVVTHIMPYFSSVGISRTISSLAATALPLVSILGRLSFGWFGDRVSKRWLFIAAFVLLAIGLGLLEYINGLVVWLITVFIILFSISWGSFTVLRIGLLRDYFGTRHFSTLFGFNFAVMTVGDLVGSPVAGLAVDKWGSYQGIWLAHITVALVGIVLMLSIPHMSVKEHK